ncbi:hypothetical protein [Botrimarina sp.]|uniref:hypothetical protein n=1 Tax=Botrimarina sp. TaxID=2795802 RepID=UPI0032EF3AD7
MTSDRRAAGFAATDERLKRVRSKWSDRERAARRLAAYRQQQRLLALAAAGRMA